LGRDLNGDIYRISNNPTVKNYYLVEATGTFNLSYIQQSPITVNQTTENDESTKWQFFGASVPGMTVSGVFSELGTMKDPYWLLYEYNGNDFALVSEADTLEEGKGYFIAQSRFGDYDFKITVPDYKTYNSQEPMIELETPSDSNSWQTFAIPHLFNVYYYNDTYTIYKMDDTTGNVYEEAEGVLEPFKGYFIQGTENINISFSPPALAKKWDFEIAVNSNGTKFKRRVNLADETSELLLKPSNCKYKNYEIPPSLNNDFVVSLFSDESDKPLFSSTSYNKDGGIWSLILENNSEDKSVSVSKNIIGEMPEYHNSVLLNVKTGEIYKDDEIEIFIKNKSKVELKILLGKQEYIDEQIELFEESIPKEFSLKQNYPNPFNPSTVIEYSVPEYSHVSISVFNVLGEKVKEIVNDFKNPGIYSAVWNGRDNYNNKVSSGIYFYSINTENFNSVKKMILLK